MTYNHARLAFEVPSDNGIRMYLNESNSHKKFHLCAHANKSCRNLHLLAFLRRNVIFGQAYFFEKKAFRLSFRMGDKPLRTPSFASHNALSRAVSVFREFVLDGSRSAAVWQSPLHLLSFSARAPQLQIGRHRISPSAHSRRRVMGGGHTVLQFDLCETLHPVTTT
jgi:hypothetical protein